LKRILYKPPERYNPPCQKEQEIFGEGNIKLRLSQLKMYWEPLELDLDLMLVLSRHLKIGNTSKHLPLNDMTLDDYKILRQQWEIDPIKFMSGIIVSLYFTGVYEGMRRLRTMAKQIQEHTTVENWKMIKKYLIENPQFNNKDVEDFESYYRLSERFPPLLNQESKEQSKIEQSTQLEVLAALGVWKSQRERLDSVDLEDMRESRILELMDDLHYASVHNGVDVKKVISTAREIESKLKSDKDSPPLVIIDSCIHSEKQKIWVPSSISAERKWLRKIYGNENIGCSSHPANKICSSSGS
jgi:hypothetical protein